MSIAFDAPSRLRNPATTTEVSSTIRRLPQYILLDVTSNRVPNPKLRGKGKSTESTVDGRPSDGSGGRADFGPGP